MAVCMLPSPRPLVTPPPYWLPQRKQAAGDVSDADFSGDNNLLHISVVRLHHEGFHHVHS